MFGHKEGKVESELTKVKDTIEKMNRTYFYRGNQGGPVTLSANDVFLINDDLIRCRNKLNMLIGLSQRIHALVEEELKEL